jgi:hypothetical protein
MPTMGKAFDGGASAVPGSASPGCGDEAIGSAVGARSFGPRFRTASFLWDMMLLH